ncbi:MAG: hypothetical protein ACTSQE_00430 [Candidatus Heimdallarchaeaceae archaeon]
MTDIIKTAIDNEAIYIVDPILVSTNVDEFLDKYGHMLETVGLIAKGSKGFTYYPSNNAPKHPNLSIFFHSFCTIADNMGIKVDVFSHVHRDAFLSQNAEFRVFSSDGNPIDLFACASQPSLSQYNAAISSEIIQYPVNKIILEDLMFPNLKSCFCDRCRRIFAQKWNIERDFSFEYLKSRDSYYNWVDFRANLISQTLRDITDTIKAVKNIDIAITIKTDKETGFLNGTKDNYGQDISNLMKITNNVIFHINPWSTLPSSTTDPEYQKLLTSLSMLVELSNSGIHHSLLFWNIKTQEEFDVAIKLRDDLNSETIYIQDGLPSDYTKLRQINLGY